MKFKKYTAFFLAFLFVIVTGCTVPQRPIVERRPAPNVTPAPAPRTNQTPINNNQRIEENLAGEIVKINGVKSATVLVNNNTAYVGIDLAQNIESTKTNTLKDEVVNKVKNIEPTITTVYVSADVDVVGRLKGYVRDIRGGKPISGLVNEIEEMFRRPAPRT